MPWWFWVLLWGALIVSAVAFLAVIILPALKRGLTLLDEAFTLVENVEDAVERANESTKRRVPMKAQSAVFDVNRSWVSSLRYPRRTITTNKVNRHAGLSESSDGSPDEIDSVNLRMLETCSKLHRKVFHSWVTFSLTRQLSLSLSS